jgi:hypothetical protein
MDGFAWEVEDFSSEKYEQTPRDRRQYLEEKIWWIKNEMIPN